jgi:Rrf2 family protein
MKFTRKTDYALRTMQFLARRYMHGLSSHSSNGLPEQTPVAVQTIAEASHLSARFLHGIVSKLSKQGLLKTVPGPKGGIALAKPPEAISILAIIEAVEGKINLMDCLEHPGGCGDAKSCSIMSILHSAQAAMVNTLRSSNLKLMVQAKTDPFHSLPPDHFLKPKFGCPVLK